MNKLKSINKEALLLLLIIALSSVIYLFFSLDALQRNFGSGDAYGILIRSFLFKENLWDEGVNLFATPYLIPVTKGLFSALTGLNITYSSLIVNYLLLIVTLVYTYLLVRSSVGKRSALIALILIGTSFPLIYSYTEPEKHVGVVSFFLPALYYLKRFLDTRQIVPLLLTTLFTWGALFSYVSAIYLVLVMVVLFLTRWKEYRHLFTKKLIIAYALIVVTTVVKILIWTKLNDRYEVLEEYFVQERLGQDTHDTIIPSFVYQYILGYINLITKGFHNRGLENFVRGSIEQIGLLSLVLGIVGAIFSRRKLLFFSTWFILFSTLVSVQYNSFSHASRYPKYIIIPVLVLAAFSLAKIGDWSRKLMGLLLLLLIGINFIFLSRVDGYRNIYTPHVYLADYIEDKVGPEAQVLHINWGTMEYNLLESSGNVLPYLHRYGFGNVDLKKFDREYIEDNSVKYFVYDRTGDDYFNSSEQLFELLMTHSTLTPVKKFVSQNERHYVILYEIALHDSHSVTLLDPINNTLQ